MPKCNLPTDIVFAVNGEDSYGAAHVMSNSMYNEAVK